MTIEKSSLKIGLQDCGILIPTFDVQKLKNKQKNNLRIVTPKVDRNASSQARPKRIFTGLAEAHLHIGLTETYRHDGAKRIVNGTKRIMVAGTKRFGSEKPVIPYII